MKKLLFVKLAHAWLCYARPALQECGVMWAVRRFEGFWTLCSVYLALAARCVFRAAPLSVLGGIKTALNSADWRTMRRMLQSSFIRGDSTFLALWPHLLTKPRGWYAACRSGVVWVLSLSGSWGKIRKANISCVRACVYWDIRLLREVRSDRMNGGWLMELVEEWR